MYGTTALVPVTHHGGTSLQAAAPPPFIATRLVMIDRCPSADNDGSSLHRTAQKYHDSSSANDTQASSGCPVRCSYGLSSPSFS